MASSASQVVMSLTQLLADNTEDTISISRAALESLLLKTEEQTNHDRSKHIDIEYQFLREYIEEGFIKLCPIDSKDNPADLFTKAVNRVILSIPSLSLCINYQNVFSELIFCLLDDSRLCFVCFSNFDSMNHSIVYH